MRLLALASCAALTLALGACATTAKTTPAAPTAKSSASKHAPTSSSSRRPPPPPTEPAPEPTKDEPPRSTQASAGEDEDDPAETGLASYYADNLAGERTASGEKYVPERATCAHRSYPFGTVLDVTAVDSGRTTTCRVNDRGPWAEGRVIDVSKKVARELGMLGPGILEVTVRKHED